LHTIVASLIIAIAPPPGHRHTTGPVHHCAAACRCPCDRSGECTCDGRTCPVAVLLTGSLPERAQVTVEGLRRKEIACPDRPRSQGPMYKLRVHQDDDRRRWLCDDPHCPFCRDDTAPVHFQEQSRER
jgi:hypothetical protein